MTENNIFIRFIISNERLYIYVYSNFILFPKNKNKNKNSYFKIKL